METPLVLMDSRRIHRSAKRMAYEIVEMNKADKPLILFGIDSRGYAVAGLLADILQNISDVDLQTVQISIKNEEVEDFSKLSEQEIDNAIPIIVDDVIFSGKTMFRALEKVATSANPAEIHTAVLIDRGHRKWPIKAVFSGMELPTKHNEHVSVIVEGRNVKSIELKKKRSGNI